MDNNFYIWGVKGSGYSCTLLFRAYTEPQKPLIPKVQQIGGNGEIRGAFRLPLQSREDKVSKLQNATDRGLVVVAERTLHREGDARGVEQRDWEFSRLEASGIVLRFATPGTNASEGLSFRYHSSCGTRSQTLTYVERYLHVFATSHIQCGVPLGPGERQTAFGAMRDVFRYLKHMGKKRPIEKLIGFMRRYIDSLHFRFTFIELVEGLFCSQRGNPARMLNYSSVTYAPLFRVLRATRVIRHFTANHYSFLVVYWFSTVSRGGCQPYEWITRANVNYVSWPQFNHATRCNQNSSTIPTKLSTCISFWINDTPQEIISPSHAPRIMCNASHAYRYLLWSQNQLFENNSSPSEAFCLINQYPSCSSFWWVKIKIEGNNDDKMRKETKQECDMERGDVIPVKVRDGRT